MNCWTRGSSSFRNSSGGATSIDVAVTDLEGRILGHRDEPADVSGAMIGGESGT